MEITKDQRDAWKENPETREWEAAIGPHYKRGDGTADVEALFVIAELNGKPDLRTRYAHLNPGQVAMSVRNRLRPLWRNGCLRLPVSE